ncbi:MAG: hypothetical protein KBA66_25140 [Leptospiraceae bacterium]|nr:hypothetical protein [Leptospiraceae bacterium]
MERTKKLLFWLVKKLLALALPITLLAVGCASGQIPLKDEAGANPISILVSKNENCTETMKTRKFDALFGLIPLRKGELDIQAKESVAHFVNTEFDWIDIATTIFGGATISLVSRTLVVYECPAEFRLVSSDEYMKLQGVANRKDKEMVNDANSPAAVEGGEK